MDEIYYHQNKTELKIVSCTFVKSVSLKFTPKTKYKKIIFNKQKKVIYLKNLISKHSEQKNKAGVNFAICLNVRTNFKHNSYDPRKSRGNGRESVGMGDQWM